MTNTEKLGALLARQMRRTVQAGQPLGLELGRIVETKRDGVTVRDLVSDSLRQTIPQGHYSALGGAGLSAGDRVVIAWLGSEPVVLGRLVST